MINLSSLPKFAGIAAALATVFVAVPKSQAATVTVLDFEGINIGTTTNYANVNDFYNGGTSSVGTSGTNFGVGFSSNALAICLNTLTESCSKGLPTIKSFQSYKLIMPSWYQSIYLE